MSIGERIKELLYDRKLSQKQLAEALKIPTTTLSGYIRNFREPDLEILKIIASYFNVTTDYLLDFNLSTVTQDEKFLNTDEMKLINLYRQLKNEQQELMIEHCLVYIKMNRKKLLTPSDTTLKTGTGKNK